MKFFSSVASIRAQPLSISKDASKSYLAKIVQLNDVRKHPNADKLQLVTIDFQNVVVGPNAKNGDVCVFFPLECAINEKFLSVTNSFRHKEKNINPEEVGFFEDNCRVRAVKLRGEKSMGYLVPVQDMENFTSIPLADRIGEEFDTINDVLICKKYVVYRRSNGQQNRIGKKPRISRLVDGQVHLHVETEQLRKNVFKITPEDTITLTYKVHGTSFWASHVLVKRKLNIIEKLLLKLGVSIKETEYDVVYGSRKVVKNEYETSQKDHYYDYDVWGDIKDQLKPYIPKGYSIYGEALGYTKNGSWIQKDYDYGCNPGKMRLMIYRVTFTNEDGVVNDLSSAQVLEFCNRSNLEYVPVFFSGKAKDLYQLDTDNHWHENLIMKLEQDYLEKDCSMCNNKVPAEGIVLRKETLFQFESYKLKSFAFLQRETELLDAGELDMESEQALPEEVTPSTDAN